MERFFRSVFVMAMIMAILAGIFSATSLPVYGAGNSDMEYALLKDINDLRKNSGLPPLELDDGLTDLARIRAKEASSNWDHRRSDGSMGFDLIPGHEWKGENLSYVEGNGLTLLRAAEIQFSNLCGSPAHLQNMLLPYYTKIGVASYRNAGGRITTAYLFSE